MFDDRKIFHRLISTQRRGSRRRDSRGWRGRGCRRIPPAATRPSPSPRGHGAESAGNIWDGRRSWKHTCAQKLSTFANDHMFGHILANPSRKKMQRKHEPTLRSEIRLYLSNLLKSKNVAHRLYNWKHYVVEWLKKHLAVLRNKKSIFSTYKNLGFLNCTNSKRTKWVDWCVTLDVVNTKSPWLTNRHFSPDVGWEIQTSFFGNN